MKGHRDSERQGSSRRVSRLELQVCFFLYIKKKIIHNTYAYIGTLETRQPDATTTGTTTTSMTTNARKRQQQLRVTMD